MEADEAASQWKRESNCTLIRKSSGVVKIGKGVHILLVLAEFRPDLCWSLQTLVDPNMSQHSLDSEELSLPQPGSLGSTLLHLQQSSYYLVSGHAHLRCGHNRWIVFLLPRADKYWHTIRALQYKSLCLINSMRALSWPICNGQGLPQPLPPYDRLSVGGKAFSHAIPGRPWPSKMMVTTIKMCLAGDEKSKLFPALSLETTGTAECLLTEDYLSDLRALANLQTSCGPTIIRRWWLLQL